MATDRGIEPRLRESKSRVLPLNESASYSPTWYALTPRDSCGQLSVLGINAVSGFVYTRSIASTKRRSFYTRWVVLDLHQLNLCLDYASGSSTTRLFYTKKLCKPFKKPPTHCNSGIPSFSSKVFSRDFLRLLVYIIPFYRKFLLVPFARDTPPTPLSTRRAGHWG